MADTTRAYEPGTHPSLPPPITPSGPILWVRKNLLGSPLNVILTLLSLYLLYLIVPGILNWAVFDAVVYAGSRDECRERGSGACWASANVRFGQFLYGFYPEDLRWRINLTAVLFLLALVPLLWDKTPFRQYWFIYSGIFPFIAYVLLVGGFGLERVGTARHGVFPLTVRIGLTGIVPSAPLGLLPPPA